MTLFSFYKLSFLVASLSAGCLSIIGRHFSARGNVLEVFLLSQLALLGNLLSKILFHSHGANYTGIVCSYIMFGLGKLFLYKINIQRDEKARFMVGGYLVLMAFQYLLIGIYPQLDSHMSIGFFGDMVTASFFDNTLLIVTFTLFTFFYYRNSKKVNRHTVEISLLGSRDKSIVELFLFAIPLVTSLYGLGFLFTMSFLLLPVLFLAKAFDSEKKAAIWMFVVSSFCASLGLGASIYFERLSTTSSQIILLVTFCFFIKKISSKK